MLFGGAVAAFAYNIRCSHPQQPQHPLIDFDLACLLGSALMAGGQVGSVVHATAPPAVLLALLTFVLADSARKSLRSAFKMSAKEDKRMDKREAEASNRTPATRPAMQSLIEVAPEPPRGLPAGAARLAALWLVLLT